MKWNSLIRGDFGNIPMPWRTDFIEKWIDTCYARTKILALTTFIYPLIIIPFLYINLAKSEPQYLVLNILPLLIMFAISGFCLFKVYTWQQTSPEFFRSKARLVLLYSSSVLFFLNFSFYPIWLRTSLNAPYVIGVFVYALMFYQPSRIGFLIYLSNHIFYLIFLSAFPSTSFHHQSIAFFSGTMASIGGWLVATMFYNSRVESFINNRTIQLQSQELQKVNEELKKLVSIDGLTQVANRRRFDQHLYSKYQELNQRATLGVLLCDVDYFKLYNDTYGHQAGDECLQRVAATIQADIRGDEDLVARYGGEEFVVILCNTSPLEATKVAQRICQHIQDLHIPHSRSPMQEVTISIGVCCEIPSAVSKAEQLISKADQALYEAKSKGRNQAVYTSNNVNVTGNMTRTE